MSLAVTLTLPDKVKSGAPVPGSLAVTNTGHVPISIVIPDYAAAMNLVVFDHYWNQVTPNSVGKVHVAYTRTDLAPGAAKVFPLADLAFTTATARMLFQLKPGTYHVAAIYHPGTAQLPDQSTYPHAAVSVPRTLIVE